VHWNLPLRHNERCAPVTVTFNLVQKLVKISRLGLFYVKKAIQLHWVAFNQPNNHHNNPTTLYTFFALTQSLNSHLIQLILKGLRKFSFFRPVCRSKLSDSRAILTLFPA